MYKQPKHPYNVLVTGGLQGIGRAIVDSFLARGDNLFVFDCVKQDDERVTVLEQKGITYFQVDVSCVQSIKNSFEKLFSQVSKLHVLVNNAGITRDMLAVRLAERDWDAVLQVNAKGAFFCAQQALKRMMKQEKSYIINMASVVGIVGNPGQINYAASKAALIAVTKTLAKEYATRNVLVNAIAPGFIQTNMTNSLSDSVKKQAIEHIPLKRFGTAQDVADLILFLTSGMADYITGQVLHVDGGMVI